METTVKERLLKFIKFKELSTHKFEKMLQISEFQSSQTKFKKLLINSLN